MADTATLDLQRACDLACSFCVVRAADTGTPASRAARAAEAARKALRDGASEIVLSGGEPSLEPWLPAVVAGLRKAGARVVLETHGCLEADLIGRLARAGLDRAVVACNTLEPELADTLAGSAGVWQRLDRGVRGLLGHGIAVELNAVVLPENAATLADLARRAAEVWPAVTPADNDGRGAAVVGLRLRPLVQRADGGAVLSPREAAATLATVVQAATLPVHITAGFELPACAYAPAQRRAATPLLRLGAALVQREGHRYRRVAACADCRLADRCPGVLPAWLDGLRDAEPVGDVAPGHGMDTLSDSTMAPHAALQLDLRHQLRGEHAPVEPAPARQPWQVRDTAPPDREAWEALSGLRQVLRREVRGEQAAAQVAEALRQQGLLASVARTARGHTLAGSAWVVWGGRDAQALDRAVRLDGEMAAPHTAERDGDGRAATRADQIAELGALLGYPACCVRAFSASADNGDARMVQVRAAAQAMPLRPEQNWAVVPLRWMSYLPCQPDCAATAAHTAHVRAHLVASLPSWAATRLQALASPVAAWSYERFVGFWGASWSGPQRLHYGYAFGLDAFDDASQLLQRRSWQLFAREILTPLRYGNSLILDGAVWRIEHNGAARGTLHFGGEGPRLLRFDAA